MSAKIGNEFIAPFCMLNPFYSVDPIFIRVENNAPVLMLGGPGTVVEIDESLLFTNKYQRGRLRQAQAHQIWMFGAVQRGTRNVRIKIVPNRRAATLLPIISDWILPGTTIMSDMWAAYGGIGNMPQGFRHLTVNHRVRPQ